MRYLLLTAALAMNMQAMVAQSSYQVKNSVTLRNEDCDLTKMSVILPVPVSNIYQDVVGLKESSGMVLDLDASNRYLRDIKTDGQPSPVRKDSRYRAYPGVCIQILKIRRYVLVAQAGVIQNLATRLAPKPV